MRLSWHDLETPRADEANGKTVEIAGWATAAVPLARADYFLLTAEPNCCAGCLPGNTRSTVEVFAEGEIDISRGALRLTGTLHVAADEEQGWRYRLQDARAIGVTRRRLLAASPLICVPTTVMAQLPTGPTIDLHSHGGNLLYVRSQGGNYPFAPLAEPMRQGGLAATCLAVVADSPTHRVTDDKRIRPYRDPQPGELYAHTERAFERLHRLIRDQNLGIVRDASGLRAARPEQPAVIVSCEGADFLEGRIERVDEAYERWQLRHLQLTHYRPNELGDIQTEPSVHGGLTAFGAEVIRRCNRLGIAVDVAHAPFAMVKQAAAIATKPLVLSHTSLIDRPLAWTRRIRSDHARVIAATGGVIGVWPPKAFFPTIASLADGIARLVDVTGIDHVGLGTDQQGLVGGGTLSGYADLPQLAAALRARFNAEETMKILGGNAQRVFERSLG